MKTKYSIDANVMQLCAALCCACGKVAKADDIISIPELRKRVQYEGLSKLTKFEPYNIDLSNFKN